MWPSSQILERTLRSESASSDEDPPPVYAPPSYDMHIYDRKHPADVPSTPPPRQAEPCFQFVKMSNKNKIQFGDVVSARKRKVPSVEMFV